MAVDDYPSNPFMKVSERLAMAALSALLLIALLTMVDAVLRWLGWTRVYGLHDLREFVFAVVVACCFPVGLLRGSSITVRFLKNVFGLRVAHHADRIAAMITLMLFGAATYGLALLSIDFMQAGRTTSTLGWPLAPWVWATTFAFVLATLAQGLRTYRLWTTDEEAA